MPLVWYEDTANLKISNKSLKRGKSKYKIRVMVYLCWEDVNAKENNGMVILWGEKKTTIVYVFLVIFCTCDIFLYQLT